MTVGLILIVTLVGFEALAVTTVMPVVERDLGGLRLYGLVFGAFMAANLVGISVSGRFADDYGPRRPFLFGLVLFGVGLASGGLSPNMAALVAARAVQGLGAGAISTCTYVLIGRGYDQSLRPRMFAVMSSAWVLPGIIGPAVAAAVAENLTWRLVFLGLLPPLPLVAALTLPSMASLPPAAPDARAERLEPVAIARLALGASLLLGGIAASPLVLAAVLVVAGAVLGAPALGRLLPPGTFRAAPGLPAVVATMALVNLAFFGAESFLPLMLTDVRGHGAGYAGLALTLVTFTWTTGAWAQERTSGRLSRRLACALGLALVLAGIVATGLADSPRVPVATALVGWAVGGLGMGLSNSTLAVLGLAEAPPERIGTYSASYQLAAVLGAALGASVGGGIIAAGESLTWATSTSIAVIFVLMAAAEALAVGVSFRLPGGQAEAAGQAASAEPAG